MGGAYECDATWFEDWEVTWGVCTTSFAVFSAPGRSAGLRIRSVTSLKNAKSKLAAFQTASSGTDWEGPKLGQKPTARARPEAA